MGSGVSHPYDIDRLDGNISCNLHCTNSLQRDTVFEGVEVTSIDFDLQEKKKNSDIEQSIIYSDIVMYGPVSNKCVQ